MIALNLENILGHINSAIEQSGDGEGRVWSHKLWLAYKTAPEQMGFAYFEFFKAVAKKAMDSGLEKTSGSAIGYACLIAQKENLGMAAYDDFAGLAATAIRAGLREASGLALTGMVLAYEEFRKKSPAGLSSFLADYKKLAEHYKIRFCEKLAAPEEADAHGNHA